jgi:hypothetical protein
MKHHLLLAFAIVFASSISLAEQIRVPVGEQNDAISTQKPTRGLSANQVESQFGAPVSRHGPVGEPPILFWEYDQFTVYFEGDYVIHAVAKVKSNTPMRYQ